MDLIKREKKSWYFCDQKKKDICYTKCAKECDLYECQLYSVFQGFSKAKSSNGGSILSLSQFLILPQLPQKIKLASKVVKDDSKIIILLPTI
jgi:hypothetical protein